MGAASENGGSVLFTGRVSSREFIYILSVIGGMIASWYGLTSKVDRVEVQVGELRRRIDEHMATTEVMQSKRIDDLSQAISQHQSSPGHAVAVERTDQIMRRMELAEHRLDACGCFGGPMEHSEEPRRRRPSLLP